MRRTFVLSLAALALLAAAAPLVSQEPEAKAPALVRVTLPENARLEIDGVKTKQAGSVRLFESPPLSAGKKYSYVLKAIWTQDGKEVTREQTVYVEGGRESAVDLRPAGAAKPSVAETKPSTPAKTTAAETKPAGPAKVEPKKNETPVTAEPQDKAKKDEKKKPRRQPDVIFVPTPQEVVDKMLEVAKVKKEDILYDLGCGDGRIPVTAAKKFGCKAWGFDIDPQRVKESLENVEKEKVGKLVTIEEKDIFTLDLSKANVITLYLLPELNVKLIPQLEKCKPGTRIVSHDFNMEGVKPDQHITMKVNDVEHEIYLWTVPLKKEKP